MFRKLKRYLRDPKFALGCDLIKKHPNWMSDRFFIETEFRLIMGYKLDLKHPKTFNEKLQWLKLYDRNPLYTNLADKLAMKDYMIDAIGAEYVVPTLAIYNSVDEINLDTLPNQFVLKCNHDSGSVVICRDKSSFDLNKAKEKLRNALKNNFYNHHREWVYKDIKPMVFAETYLDYDLNTTMKNNEMVDYKFYCFNGEPKFLYVSQGLEAQDTASINYLNMNYSIAPFQRLDFVYFDKIPPKPSSFEKMVELSKNISRGFPFVRVDWFECGGRPYISELTFYPGGSPTPIKPFEYEYQIGDWLNLK